MTAALKISSASITPPPAPRGAQWLDSTEAAARMGVSETRIRQQCAEEWFALGLAEQRRPDDGGKRRWYVRNDADVRLARCIAPADRPFAWGKYTDAQRVELRWRRDALIGWEDATAAAIEKGISEGAATADYVGRLQLDQNRPISAQTLYRWRRDFKARGWAGLVDKRWTTAADERRDDDDAFLEALRHLYLDKRKRTKKFCFDTAADIAQDRGWSVPTYRTACRYLDTIPIKTLTLFRDGDKAYNDKTAPYIQRDYTTIDSNDVWCGDHHRFDFMVDAGDGKLVRPWCTAWEDVRSRMIVGWTIYLHDPNQNTILSTFRDGCLNHGVPKSVYIDNGKDYDSRSLQGETKKERQLRRGNRAAKPPVDEGVFGELEISVRHALPYHAQSKPIERMFGTLCARFSKIIPTYCGNSPAARPDDLFKKQAPNLAEVIELFRDWLDADYHSRAHMGHGMDGRTPAQVFAACLRQKRTTTAEALNLLTLKKTRPVTVGKVGVTWRGIRYGSNAPELWTLFGQKVVLRIDERDCKHVLVYREDGTFVCDAKANVRLPFNATEQQVREAHAENKRDKKLARDYYERRPRMADDIEDRLRRRAAVARAKAHRPDPTVTPPSLVPVRTPPARELEALQAAMDSGKLRKAVGAESMTPQLSWREIGEKLAMSRATAQPPPEPFDTLVRIFERRDSKEAGHAKE